MPGPIVALARRFMSNPIHIRATDPDEGLTQANISHLVYRAHSLDKDEVIARILQADGRGKTVIFTRTKRAAQRLSDELGDRGFNTASVHGDMSQEARERSMAAFKAGKKDVLIATDVAARGIDVDDVTHVINHTIPDDEKTYLHRAGRTGRAGKTGIAVTFVDWDDLHKWALINRALEFGQPEPDRDVLVEPAPVQRPRHPRRHEGTPRRPRRAPRRSRRRMPRPRARTRADGTAPPSSPHRRRRGATVDRPVRARARLPRCPPTTASRDARRRRRHARRRRQGAPRRQRRPAPPSSPSRRSRGGAAPPAPDAGRAPLDDAQRRARLAASSRGVPSSAPRSRRYRERKRAHVAPPTSQSERHTSCDSSTPSRPATSTRASGAPSGTSSGGSCGSFVFIAYLFALFAVIGDLFRDHKLNGWWKADLDHLPDLRAVPDAAGLPDRPRQRHGRARRGAGQAAPGRPGQLHQVGRRGTSPSDEIAKAKALLDAGTITQAEFDAHQGQGARLSRSPITEAASRRRARGVAVAVRGRRGRFRLPAR